MHTAASPRRYGDYVLLESLGQGGMSAVDLARRSVDSAGFVRFLVIKRILAKNTTDPTFVRMFMDEARINAELQHENIAQVYDFGERDGEWYLAMEYVPGIDLRRLQKAVSDGKEGGALLPPRISLRILHDVLSALQYAHQRVDTFGQPMNIVHRDVNPRNIMVSVRGEVKLIDFGVAKADTRHDQTTGQTIKGKFAYMAPEQIESPHPVDGRADLFAIGLVLQELLTGSHPFRHLSEIQIIHRLMSGRVDPMPDSALHPDPHAVRAVRDRAMAQKPDDRYPDARAFQEDLVRLAAPIGGLATRSELAGFFRRAAPEASALISHRLESWRNARAPLDGPPLLSVPPDADLNEDTWASDMRTAEIPEDLAPGLMEDTGGPTLADAGPIADATVADPPSFAPPETLAPALGEQSASSVVVALPPRTNTLPVVAAVVVGGGLGLAALAVLAVAFIYMNQPTEPVVVPPSTEPVQAAVPPEPPPAAPAEVQATEPAPTKPAPTQKRTPKPKQKRAASPAPPEAPPEAAPTEAPADPPEATPEPPPEKAETKPEDASSGFLFATSRPSGFEVLFQGRSLGTTPLRNVVIPVGTHTITFRDPQTGATVTRTVSVQQNQPTMVKVQQ